MLRCVRQVKWEKTHFNILFRILCDLQIFYWTSDMFLKTPPSNLKSKIFLHCRYNSCEWFEGGDITYIKCDTKTNTIANAVIPWMEEQDDSESDESSVFSCNPPGTPTPCTPCHPTTHCYNAQHSSTLQDCLDLAERTAILFDANLGHTPTANRDNLTFALWSGVKTAAISKAERDGMDANSFIKLVDDAVSCVTTTEFLGTRSAPFENKQSKADPCNKSFCSMPVKLTFRDRGSRINFEQTMRSLCNLCAAISLPKHISDFRTLIADKIKSSSLNCFVSIRLNSENQSLVALTKKEANSQWERHSVFFNCIGNFYSRSVSC